MTQETARRATARRHAQAPLPAQTGFTRDEDNRWREAETGPGRTREGAGERRGGPKAAIPIALLAVLAGAYLAGVAYFSGRFLPNTTLNGADVSLGSPDELASHLSSDFSSYQLKVSGDGVDLTIATQDVDYTFDAQGYYDGALAQQNPWAWPAAAYLGSQLDSELGHSYDQGKLQALVDGAVQAANASATQPTNASLSYDGNAKAFVVVPEQMGTAVDASLVQAEVEKALGAMENSLELGDECLLKPSLTADSDAMRTALDQANRTLAATQTLTANGTAVAEVGVDQIAQWVSVAEDGSVSVDSEAIKAWAQGDLSKSLDTVGTTRTYTRADGKEVSVSGGRYGWSVDGAALSETLATNIASATPQTVEVPWKTKGAQWAMGTPDWGARYIDVDISEQHARMYDESGNLVWESDFVSGKSSEGRDTPQGVYEINANKGTDQTLIGLDEDHDGEPDYKSDVAYWIPFIDNMVAFHDAPWRSKFGGTIYQTAGSHGCVNLPPEAAAELYQITNVGDVVVVHS